MLAGARCVAPVEGAEADIAAAREHSRVVRRAAAGRRAVRTAVRKRQGRVMGCAPGEVSGRRRPSQVGTGSDIPAPRVRGRSAREAAHPEGRPQPAAGAQPTIWQRIFRSVARQERSCADSSEPGQGFRARLARAAPVGFCRGVASSSQSAAGKGKVTNTCPVGWTASVPGLSFDSRPPSVQNSQPRSLENPVRFPPDFGQPPSTDSLRKGPDPRGAALKRQGESRWYASWHS
jgi:hypothetical protein